jgi:hypothetical protein
MENYLLQFMPYLEGYRTKEKEQEKDISDVVFDSRLGLVKSQLEAITARITERAEMRDSHHAGILYDEAAIDNMMHGLPDRFTPYQPMSRESLQLEQLKLRLSDSRRMENASAWRDVSMLYTQAMDAYLELQKQKNKKDLISNL